MHFWIDSCLFHSAQFPGRSTLIYWRYMSDPMRKTGGNPEELTVFAYAAHFLERKTPNFIIFIATLKYSGCDALQAFFNVVTSVSSFAGLAKSVLTPCGAAISVCLMKRVLNC